MNRVYLQLGSNLDDRIGLLASATEKIVSGIGKLIARSSIYESEPWGFEAEQNFLNQVIVVETDLSPSKLLAAILEIEKSLGRIRSKGIGYQSRPIDIDILFFNEEVISSRNLDIPHPRIQERLFTLLPLGELDEGLVHPLLDKTIGQLLSECGDRGKVAIFNSIGLKK